MVDKQATGVNKLKNLEKLVNSVSGWLNWVTLAGLVVMSLVTVIDVVSHKLFHSSILWAYDLTSLLGLVVLVFALAFTQVKRGHIEIDLVTNRVSERAQLIISSVINLLGVALFAAMTWQMGDFALNLQETGRGSSVQNIPLAPFGYATAFCFLVLCLTLVLQLIKSVIEAVKR